MVLSFCCPAVTARVSCRLNQSPERHKLCGFRNSSILQCLLLVLWLFQQFLGSIKSPASCWNFEGVILLIKGKRSAAACVACWDVKLTACPSLWGFACWIIVLKRKKTLAAKDFSLCFILRNVKDLQEFLNSLDITFHHDPCHTVFAITKFMSTLQQ